MKLFKFFRKKQTVDSIVAPLKVIKENLGRLIDDLFMENTEMAMTVQELQAKMNENGQEASRAMNTIQNFKALLGE